MRNSAGFSGENLTLVDIAYYYLDSEQALRAYLLEPRKVQIRNSWDMRRMTFSISE